MALAETPRHGTYTLDLRLTGSPPVLLIAESAGQPRRTDTSRFASGRSIARRRPSSTRCSRETARCPRQRLAGERRSRLAAAGHGRAAAAHGRLRGLGADHARDVGRGSPARRVGGDGAAPIDFRVTARMSWHTTPAPTPLASTLSSATAARADDPRRTAPSAVWVGPPTPEKRTTSDAHARAIATAEVPTQPAVQEDVRRTARSVSWAPAAMDAVARKAEEATRGARRRRSVAQRERRVRARHAAGCSRRGDCGGDRGGARRRPKRPRNRSPPTTTDRASASASSSIQTSCRPSKRAMGDGAPRFRGRRAPKTRRTRRRCCRSSTRPRSSSTEGTDSSDLAAAAAAAAVGRAVAATSSSTKTSPTCRWRCPTARTVGTMRPVRAGLRRTPDDRRQPRLHARVSTRWPRAPTTASSPSPSAGRRRRRFRHAHPDPEVARRTCRRPRRCLPPRCPRRVGSRRTTHARAHRPAAGGLAASARGADAHAEPRAGAEEVEHRARRSKEEVDPRPERQVDGRHGRGEEEAEADASSRGRRVAHRQRPPRYLQTQAAAEARARAESTTDEIDPWIGRKIADGKYASSPPSAAAPRVRCTRRPIASSGAPSPSRCSIRTIKKTRTS